jgi:hypothetical protein
MSRAKCGILPHEPLAVIVEINNIGNIYSVLRRWVSDLGRQPSALEGLAAGVIEPTPSW